MSKSPDAFRTISEAAEMLDTPAHVLRFWESKFTQIRPLKRAGGRRYYRRNDMSLLAGIKKLLHEDGLTIKGAQKILREQGIKHVISIGEEILAAENAPYVPATEVRAYQPGEAETVSLDSKPPESQLDEVVQKTPEAGPKSAPGWPETDPVDADFPAEARLFHLISRAPADRLAARAEVIAPMLRRIENVRNKIAEQ